jgi:hypothetical protein
MKNGMTGIPRCMKMLFLVPNPVLKGRQYVTRIISPTLIESEIISLKFNFEVRAEAILVLQTKELNI